MNDRFTRILLFAVFSLACNLTGRAGNIKGFLKDARTGEVLSGATVRIDNTGYGAISGLDGSYLIRDVPDGHYQLRASLLAYTSAVRNVDVNGENATQEVDFSLLLSSNNLHEVDIVAHASGGDDAGARLLEKNADNVMNILSARTIQLMPDITVANILRRVSGVTVDRSSEGGEGRYPVIRGMDKRYNYTLVNGIKIPSPDDKNRYVPMDIFPSEILQRLEVIKALTPDMEGDAIGGVMNLVLKEAPDHFMLYAQGALGYSQMLFNDRFAKFDYSSVAKKSPAELHGSDYIATADDFSKANLDYKHVQALPDGQLGLTIGDRFLHDKLGLLFSGSYQNLNRTEHELFLAPNPQPDPDPPPGNNPAFDDLELRNYYTHQMRAALHGKIDYRLNEHNTISLYTIFLQLNSFQTRHTVDTSLSSTSRTGLGEGVVNILDRSKENMQSVYNATLQGNHAITDHWLLNWSAAYSIAAEHNPDEAELAVQHQVNIDAEGDQSTTDPVLLAMNRFWQHNTDRDMAGYLNLHYKFTIGIHHFDIAGGAMYRHKHRDNYYNTYTLQPQIINQSTQKFTGIDDAKFVFSPPNAGIGSQKQDPNIYASTEDISAGYAEARWQTDKWNVLAGLRAENTDQHYDQYTLPDSYAGKTGSISYLDLLPSLHIKYNIDAQQDARLSYFKSISRPGFYEIVPYFKIGEYFNEAGNPNLKHVQADNIDLRYEYFPGGADQLLLGAFYKNILNPIEYTYKREASSTSELIPSNFGTAKNYGAEIVLTKYFHYFGISGNYTYTHSNIRTAKSIYYRDDQGSITSRSVSQDRPLQGQAEHIGNLSLLYKNPENGLDLQLSGIYSGRHIVYLSPYAGLDYWQKGNCILDFSAEKTVGKHFSVYAKLNNLLNTPDEVELIHENPFQAGNKKLPEQTEAGRILVEKKTYGQTYLIGLRYHLL